MKYRSTNSQRRETETRFSVGEWKRYCAVCALVAVTGGVAQAGIFHRKHKLTQKDDALASVQSQQPDKALFDRAMIALKKNRFDVARLDLQTLLNTYPDSEYAMRAKLAIGDTWYKEGGTAALAQAEEEYKDFITFFPDKPEAAEAQMKVADIYYKQMEKPDRDPTNAIHAQQEYRAMILQYPDSTLIPQAKQRLREVQEVLGDHEFSIGSFYQTRMNYAASIARLQSMVDNYPLYSRADEALLDIGDAYAAQAKHIEGLKLNGAAKERLEKLYSSRAQHAYDRVILEYPMAPHADDARDRLEALNLPLPQPTPQELATSSAIEQSRAPVNLKYRAVILITARPSVIQAARVGDPSLTDSAQIMAPAIVKESVADLIWAVKPDGKPAPTVPGASNSIGAVAAATSAQMPAIGATPAPAITQRSSTPTIGLQMRDLSNGSTDVNGAVVGPNNNSSTGTQTTPSAGTNGSSPTAWPSAKPDNGGIPTVGPKNNVPLPAAQSAAPAPGQINDVPAGGHQVNTANENASAHGKKKKKKNPKPKFHQKQESSSTHKKKKGLRKLNPF